VQPGIYAEIKRRGGKADLSARARFELTGADRVRFLNGQVSSDVRRLSAGCAQYACVLTAKGKMSGDVFITAEADRLLLDADASLRESLAARLERYIISDDVTLRDITDETALIHIFGLPEAAGVRSRRFGADGFDLLMPVENFPRAWKALAPPAANEELLEVLRVEAGLPRWGRELTEETLPVEAGLDKTAIDYDKGCYIGQEIISRLKSVGHVNKQLSGFVSASPLEPGARLQAPDGREAGWLTSAVYSFGLEKYAALGYLKRGVALGACQVEARELPLIP